MNAKKFSDAMSELDTKYVDEALNHKKKAKRPGWIKWGAMAACLCLVVYAGIRLIPTDSPPDESRELPLLNAQFEGGDISKRGNRYLRKTGYEVMQSYVMHKPANDPIFTFIEKKRGEGKSGKLAMVAGLNKFLRVYYGKVTELYRSLPAIE